MLLRFYNGIFLFYIILVVKVSSPSTQSPTTCHGDDQERIPPYVADCVRLNYETSPKKGPNLERRKGSPPHRVKRQPEVWDDLAGQEELIENEELILHLSGGGGIRHSSIFTSHLDGAWKYDIHRPPSFKKISLSAFEREFELLLMTEYREMAPDIQILTVSAHRNESSLDSHLHLQTLYKGIVKGDAYSHVEGSIIDGVFAGKITVSLDFGNGSLNANATYNGVQSRPNDNYHTLYVERTHRDAPFHSIIYSENHLRDQVKPVTTEEPTHPDKGDIHVHDSWCGLSDEKNLNWMMSHYENTPMRPAKANRGAESHSYKKKVKLDDIPNVVTSSAKRRKRSILPVKNTCSIFIQTDPFLWNHISKKLNTKDKSRIREEIIAMISSHINAVNHIYGSTQFGDIVGIQFVVQRIKILEDTYCDNIVSQKQGSYCNANLDVSNVLNLWSLENHDDFCLAYLWTYRDFIGGTLGLAWVAASEREAGGLCESYKPYSEFVQNKRLTTYKSLNTGIITLVNYGSPVSPRVTHLTFAHEIGHNLGSPHDYPLKCRPGQAFSDPGGNYIMFSSATSGDRLNNDKFSQCSKRNVSQILEAIIFEKHGKVNCLIKSDGAFCGNGLKEAGEECDCGYPEECQANGEIMCCYPRTEDLTKSCKKRPNVMCSPSEGQCCTKQCKHVTTDTVCAQETECSYRSYCSGQSAQCPPPRFKANRTTACNDNTQVCWNGQCAGSICQKVNLEPCFITAPKDDKHYDRGKLCELACQMPNQPETCKSSYEYPALRNINRGRGINLKPGSPCNNFQGYCDVLLKCREVDTEGPLTRLKNLIFNTRTFSLLKYWIKVHWWAISLIAFSLMILMGIFIKCCAVHTPSSNPKKPPARSFSDTMSRTANTIRRTGHQMVHTAYTLRRNASNAQYHHSSSSFAIEPRAQATAPISQAQRASSRNRRSQSSQQPHGNGAQITPNASKGKMVVVKNGKSAVRAAKNGLANGNRVSASDPQNGGHHYYKKSSNRKSGRHRGHSSADANHPHSGLPNGQAASTSSDSQNQRIPTSPPYSNNGSNLNNNHHSNPHAILHHPGPHYVGAHYGNHPDLVLRERDLFTRYGNAGPPNGGKERSKKRKKKEKDKKKSKKELRSKENATSNPSNNNYQPHANNLTGTPPVLNMNIAEPMLNHPTSNEVSFALPHPTSSQPINSATPPNIAISSFDQPPPPYTPSAPPGETSFSIVKSSNLPRGGYGKNRGLYNQAKKDSSSTSDAVSSKKKKKNSQ